MKKFLVLSVIVLFFSCSKNSKQTTDVNTHEDRILNSSKKLEYKVGSNYFVKNNFDAKLINKSYIDSQEIFDSVFGVARTMSPDGLPTQIDFNSEFVIPIILEQTNIGSTITIDSIRLNGNLLSVNYTVNEVEPISYIIQPSEVIILKKTDIVDFSNLKLKFEKTKNVL